MYSSGGFVLLMVVVLAVYDPCTAFPKGAPIDTCIKANRPNHYGTKARAPFDSKHDFYATSSYYEPGTTISVYITGPDFKGFFIQARDAKTKQWIGTFQETDFVRSFHECSAATHKKNDPKQHMELVWHAPPHGRGEVFFTGTILSGYATYWSDMVAKVSRPLRLG